MNESTGSKTRGKSPGTAFVTGGGTGLGRAVSLALADAGHPVVVFSRSSEHVSGMEAELRGRGARSLGIAGDVRDPAAVESAVARAEEDLGPIEVLINNAAGNFLVPSEDLTPNGFRAVVEIVLHGTWFCSSAVGRRMLERGRGCMVNVIATYAETGMPGVAHSAAAKAGVLSLTRTLASEWGARGIRVNAVAPGIMVTKGAAANLNFADAATQEKLVATIPARRLATLEEVAASIAYLCSPAADYVTGACLTIDGGLSLPGGFLRRA